VTVLPVGAGRPREGVEYSSTLDRGEALPAARLLVAVVEGFAGGVALRVAFEASPDSAEFATLAEGPLLLEDHLMFRGTRLLEADLPAGAPRYLRLRYDSTGRHRVGALFGGLVSSEATSSVEVGDVLAGHR
jgi:hypothetical protein